SGELAQEAQIVLKKELHVVNAVFELRETVNAKAKRVPGKSAGVVIYKAVHRRIDHARAEKLNPTRMLAQPAAASVTREATGVNLDARLGKGEITRTKTRFGAGPEEFAHEIFD